MFCTNCPDIAPAGSDAANAYLKKLNQLGAGKVPDVPAPVPPPPEPPPKPLKTMQQLIQETREKKEANDATVTTGNPLPPKTPSLHDSGDPGILESKFVDTERRGPVEPTGEI